MNQTQYPTFVKTTYGDWIRLDAIKYVSPRGENSSIIFLYNGREFFTEETPDNFMRRLNDALN